MKAVKKLVSAVLAMVCGIGLAVPVGVSAEELFPDGGGNLTTTYYNSADINRNGDVEITDYMLLDSYLKGTRYVESEKLMDVDRNGIISPADLECCMNEVIEASGYANYVDGYSSGFSTSAVTFTHTPTGETSRTYYRHVYQNISSAPGHSDGTYTLYCNDTALPTSVSSPDGIVDTDDMYPETDVDMKSGIVRLSSGGTGFVVGDHVIATAAHCVYDKDTHEWENNLYVQFPENNLYSNPSCIYVNPNSTKYYAVQAHIDNRYYTNTTNYFDVALITVSNNLSNRYHFKLGVLNTKTLIRRFNAYLTGFPESHSSWWNVNGNSQWLNCFMYTGYDKFYSSTGVYPQYVNYKTDSVGGNSGSPVYVKETGGNTTYDYLTVVAIHQGVGATDLYNRGTRLDAQYLKFFLNNNQIIY